MAKRKHWAAKLSKGDKAHIKETGCNLVSLDPFKRNLKFQRESNIECFECEQIARKLGV